MGGSGGILTGVGHVKGDMTFTDVLEDDPDAIASVIEHTNVDPTATEEEIRTLCREVLDYGFHAAVVVPYHAPLAADLLDGRANVVAVVGFPYGVQNTEAKLAEARALLDHADELDMVMNRTAFANGDDDLVVRDVRAVKEAIDDRTLKCIIESPDLTQAEIRRAAELVAQGGADFVKTAVGYDGPTDASHIEVMRDAVGPDVGLKASGGIRTFDEAREMVAAGASRIGASASVEIYESIP